MMINDDEHDDDHDNDDVMHDMHTNTMHHAWCNAWYKGNTQRTNAQMHKNTKNKRNVTKTCKNIQGTNKQWRSKKPWQQNKTNTKGAPNPKGSLKPETHTTKQGRDTHETRRTPHNSCDGGHSPSPIRPRTPRRSAHPSLLVENLVDNSSNPCHNVSVVMWKTPKPVENPVENPAGV